MIKGIYIVFGLYILLVHLSFCFFVCLTYPFIGMSVWQLWPFLWPLIYIIQPTMFILGVCIPWVNHLQVAPSLMTLGTWPWPWMTLITLRASCSTSMWFKTFFLKHFIYNHHLFMNIVLVKNSFIYLLLIFKRYLEAKALHQDSEFTCLIIHEIIWNCRTLSLDIVTNYKPFLKI